MSRFNPMRNGFVAGEWSPRMEGRDDLEGYFQSMRQSKNGIVTPQGGWTRRPGTEYVAETKTSATASRLIPFVFNLTTAYAIEAGNLYFRFYANEGQVQTTGTFADGATFADGGGWSDGGTAIEVTTPYTSAQLPDLQWAQVGDVMYIVHPDHPPYKLTRTSAVSFTMAEVEWTNGKAPLLAENFTSTTITVTGAGPSYTLTASTAIFDTADDEGRAVRIEIASSNGFYKLDAAPSSTTVATATLEGGTDHSGAGASADWALGAFSDTEGARSIAFHEARLWFGGCPRDGERIMGSNSDLFQEFSPGTDDAAAVYVQAVTSGTINTVQWLVSTEKQLWVGNFSGEGVVEPAEDKILTPTSARFRPRTKRGSIHTMPVLVGSDITFLQRGARKLRQLSFALAADKFNAIDISILADHILYDEAVEMAYQQDPDSVVWIVRADGALVGFTIETEQKVIGAHAHELGGFGDVGLNPAVVESAASIPNPDGTADQVWVIVKRWINGATVRYVEFLKPRFNANLSPRATYDERVDAAMDAWFLDSALERDNPITVSNITQATRAVVTTATSSGYTTDQTIRIDGVEGMTNVNRGVYLIEVIDATSFYLRRDDTGDYIDSTGFSAYTQGGETRLMTDTVSGLDHLEGETVQILGDGGAHPDRTVSGGAITLQRKAARVVVGFHPETYGETQRFVGGGRIGTDQGQKARTQRLAIRLSETSALQVSSGPNPPNLESVKVRQGSWDYDAPPELFSGDRDLPIEVAWGKSPTVYWFCPEPTPVTILAIMPRAESTER